MKRFYFLLFAALVFEGCVALVPFLPENPQAKKLSRSPIEGASSKIAYVGGSQLRSREIHQLIGDLSATETVVRIHAASELGERGVDAKVAIPYLIRSLADQHKWVRRQAAKSLGKLGARQAIQPLRKALGDKDEWVAHSAKNALQKIASLSQP